MQKASSRDADSFVNDSAFSRANASEAEIHLTGIGQAIMCLLRSLWSSRPINRSSKENFHPD